MIYCHSPVYFSALVDAFFLVFLEGLGHFSTSDIVRYLNEHQIKNLRGANWNTARISEMLRNPVYVEADIDVYQFFQSQGANIYNPASDFTGYNACYLYKGTVSTSRKQSDLSDKEIVLAPHKGFIPSKTWLACRIRCLNNRQSTKTCKPKNSWLVGKVKCGKCGYALTIRKTKTKWGRYFVCSQSGSLGSNCTGAGSVLMKYIDEKISELDAERKVLQEEIVTANVTNTEGGLKQITNHVKTWETLSFEDRQAVVDTLIKVIRIADGNIEITWNI